jgi:hypothetical protein
MRTNKVARALVSVPDNRVLEVEGVALTDMPLTRDDANEALALAKASPELRREIGDTLEQYTLLDPGSDARVPFAAGVLPLRSSDPNDRCSVDRCLDLSFRTETAYLPLRAHVDLTSRTVSVERGGPR